MRAAVHAVGAALLLGASAAEVRAQDTASVAPTPETPRFVVVGHRPRSDVNRAAADTVARALQARVRIDTLWVVEKRHIEAALSPSPYRDRDEHWSLSDLHAFGRQFAAAYVLDVAATPDSAGVRLFAELFWIAGRDTLPIGTLDAAGPTVARAAEALVDRLLLDAVLLGLRRETPR